MLQKALAEIERQLCCFRIRISVSRFARVAFKWSYSGLFRADSLARLRAAARLKFCALHTSCARAASGASEQTQHCIAIAIALVSRARAVTRSLARLFRSVANASEQTNVCSAQTERTQASKQASERPTCNGLRERSRTVLSAAQQPSK